MTTPTKVLIFTGAGVGVPLGLPTSTGFGDEVTAGGVAVTQRAIEFLRGVSAKDIERILATLESLQSPDFLEHLLPMLAGGDPAGAQRRLSEFKSDARGEIKRIKKLIFAKLAGYDHAKAVLLYRGLLTELKTQYPSFALSIITTNYDLTFETTLEEQGEDEWKTLGITDFDFGFSTNKFGRPIYDRERDFDWKPETLEYLKVHGSLDWHRDEKDQCSRSLSRTVPDNPDQMAILYPGFKGVPDREPFASLHGRLSARLAQADVIFVLGFAFRDAYINSILENVLRIRKGPHVYCFNPLAMKDHPDDSMAPRLAREFSHFHHVEKPVEASDTPLGLASVLAP